MATVQYGVQSTTDHEVYADDQPQFLNRKQRRAQRAKARRGETV